MEDFNPKEIGYRIRQLRQQKKQSQAELGRHLSRTHAAVSDIELGKTNLTVQDLSKIADFLGVSVGDILNGPSIQPQAHEYHRFAKDTTREEQQQAQNAMDDWKRKIQELKDQDAR